MVIALGCAHLDPALLRLRLHDQPVRAARPVPPIADAARGASAGWPGAAAADWPDTPAGSFTALPGYWSQAATYLAAHSAHETALIVPANAHGQFTWGDTIDDPLEPLATSPWAERGQVPYGGAGSQVLLATAEQAVEAGEQVPGLAAFLARAGIRYVVVRNDVSPEATGYTPPQIVNETLASPAFAGSRRSGRW